MMKTFTIFSLTVLPFLSFAQQGAYLVQGQLAIQRIPEWAYLLGQGESQSFTDSVEIRDGGFSFRGTVTSPLLANLFTGRTLQQAKDGFCLAFYLERDTILINSPDTLRHAQVDAGEVNRLYQVLQQDLAPVYEQLGLFGKAYLTDLQRYYTIPDQVAEPSIEGLNSRYREKFSAIEQLHWRITTRFVKSYPDSIVSLDAIYTSAKGNKEVKDLSTVMNLLSAEVKGSRNVNFPK